MNFLANPMLGCMGNHADVGAPVVAGISLAPLSPGAASRFAAIGSEFIVPASAAEAALLNVATGPAALAEAHLAALDGLLAKVRGYPKEAARLLPPVVGDEAAKIAGMVGTLDAAVPMLPASIFTEADFLREHVGAAAGLNVAPVVAALDALDTIRAKIAAAEAELTGIKQELAELKAKAETPESAEDARKRRVNAKASRLVPALISELQRVRDDAARTLDALDKALTELRAVA